jgi:hypothetical protein
MKELNHEEFETAPLPNIGRNRSEAGFSVGQEASGLVVAPTIPAATAPKSGGRSVPEIGGESDFGMNAKPENSSTAVEYVPRASNLPETVELAQTERDAWDYTNIYWGGK